MKKNFLVFTAIIVLSATAAVNAQTPKPAENSQLSEACKNALDEINRLSGETTNFFKQNKLTEAYSSARKASDLAEGNCQTEKEKRLTTAMNLAAVQIKRDKNEEARIIFKNNLPLAEALYGENSPQLDTYLNYLIKLSINKTNNAEFEQYALKSLKIKKAVFGNESYETMLELHRIAVFYERGGMFNKAENYYLEAVAIYDKLPPDARNEKIPVITSYRALLIMNLGEEGRRKDAEFMKRRTEEMIAKGDSNRVLNGRAISLPKLSYPSMPKELKFSEEIKVSVTIDEKGDVIKAKVISGHWRLHQIAIDSARIAKFLPTYVNGEAVQVTGMIIYNFIP